MPPPEDPLPLPRPKPKPKPPKHKPRPPKPEAEMKPRPEPHKPEPEMKPRPEPVRDQAPGGVVPFPLDPSACAADCSEPCAYYRLCPPPPPPSSSRAGAATVHILSSRLPTPLIALSASVLAVSVVLLVVLLVCQVVRRRRQAASQQETPLTAHHVDEEEGGPVLAVAAAAEEEGADGGVHHVWYIRTVGLDERAIAAITALVYDADKCGGRVGMDDGGCAVCLAEFRDGETLRLLPRCRHAFHRGCIDTWLRAHVNCPLCRAPVQLAGQAASGNAAPSAATAAPGTEPAANLGAARGAGAEEADRDGALPERAVRRATSMVALPRLPWPDVSLRAPASNSGREGEMGLVKITRLLKLSEALEMAGMGAGRSVSFGSGSCLRLPARSGPSAAGVNADEVTR